MWKTFNIFEDLIETAPFSPHAATRLQVGSELNPSVLRASSESFPKSLWCSKENFKGHFPQGHSGLSLCLKPELAMWEISAENIFFFSNSLLPLAPKIDVGSFVLWVRSRVYQFKWLQEGRKSIFDNTQKLRGCSALTGSNLQRRFSALSNSHFILPWAWSLPNLFLNSHST